MALLLALSLAHAKRRHHNLRRLRRVAEPQQQNDFDVLLRLEAEQVQNVHKPTFNDCENFKASVQEGAERGKNDRDESMTFLRTAVNSTGG